MHEPVAYEYAWIRVVPRVDREEFVNVGVVVFARPRQVLEVWMCVSEGRLRALWPKMDVETVRRHLHAVERICAGDRGAGAIARLSQSERFHWITAPRSTIIQVSPVRSGVTRGAIGLAKRLAREGLDCDTE